MLGLAFSPDDAQLVSCSSDHSVKVSVRVRVRVRVSLSLTLTLTRCTRWAS